MPLTLWPHTHNTFWTGQPLPWIHQTPYAFFARTGLDSMEAPVSSHVVSACSSSLTCVCVKVLNFNLHIYRSRLLLCVPQKLSNRVPQARRGAPVPSLSQGLCKPDHLATLPPAALHPKKDSLWTSVPKHGWSYHDRNGICDVYSTQGAAHTSFTCKGPAQCH